jgi:hypothetical protein
MTTGISKPLYIVVAAAPPEPCYVIKNSQPLDRTDPTASNPSPVRGNLQKKTLEFVHYYITYMWRSLGYSNSACFLPQNPHVSRYSTTKGTEFQFRRHFAENRPYTNN